MKGYKGREGETRGDETLDKADTLSSTKADTLRKYQAPRRKWFEEKMPHSLEIPLLQCVFVEIVFLLLGCKAGLIFSLLTFPRPSFFLAVLFICPQCRKFHFEWGLRIVCAGSCSGVI